MNLEESKKADAEVSRGFCIKNQGDGYSFEGYVECEPEPSVSFCWWLEATVTEKGWSIGAAILRDRSPSQDTIFEFKERTGVTVKELIDSLNWAAQDLIVSATAFEFADYMK